MKSNLWRDYTVDQDKIEELRVKVYEYTRTHPDEIDMNDVKNRIISPEDIANNNIDVNNNQTTDWMLKRMLIANHKDVDSALKKFVEFFKFRNEMQMSKMNLQNCLPREFFKLCPFDTEGFDRENNKNIIIRLKYYRKMPQLDLLIKRGILYFAEQNDLQYEQGQIDGICIILDCQDFSMSNMDMDMLQFVVKQVPFYYTGLVRYALVYEIPFLLNYVFKIVESWIPSSTDQNGNKRKRFFSVNKKTIKDYSDDDQRPDYMNGTRKVQRVVPDGALSFTEMVQYLPSIEEQNARKIHDYLTEMCAAC